MQQLCRCNNHTVLNPNGNKDKTRPGPTENDAEARPKREIATPDPIHMGIVERGMVEAALVLRRMR